METPPNNDTYVLFWVLHENSAKKTVFRQDWKPNIYEKECFNTKGFELNLLCSNIFEILFSDKQRSLLLFL